MAYAEKRGKGPRPWRVKYKVPGGEASQSGFETKQAALGWGRDQEAKVRAGTWTDPGAGEITVSEWIDRWTAMQDVGPSTMANREYRIGLERDLLLPSLINVEWQLREVSGRFCRLPPKDDSYRSTNVEPLTPVDIPAFLAGLLTAQADKNARQRCTCAAEHDGSGRYVFLGPDGGHHRNSNYARRIFRPACDGRHPPANGGPGKLVIADATAWPGTPAAAWPPAVPGKP